mmetsp:Transcript_66050/g.116909  ORF Transcript_66050/g.116909 Transcript_66050/m.116909 type:complete len:97 (+) Transcript_66050:187-477(+)
MRLYASMATSRRAKIGATSWVSNSQLLMCTIEHDVTIYISSTLEESQAQETMPPSALLYKAFLPLLPLTDRINTDVALPLRFANWCVHNRIVVEAL